MSWDFHFPNPIKLPDGRFLISLRDARDYIANLPKGQPRAPAWQHVMSVLVQTADEFGAAEFARFVMMQALYPKPEPIANDPSGIPKRDPKWRLYKPVRDR